MSIRYWTGAVGSIVRNAAYDVRAALRGEGECLPFVRRFITSGYAYDRRPRCDSVHFLDAYPNAAGQLVNLSDVHFNRSNANAFELYCLMSIVQLRNARRIFEIGTFDGATTLRLAQQCPTAEILTLDLPPSAESESAAVIDEERSRVCGNAVGECFRDTPEAARITQLYGDSRTFDYTQFAGMCDIVFVDACHEYEYARSDTRSAQRLCKPNSGVVVWHDYIAGWPGVIRAVDESRWASPPFNIAGTSLAVMDPAAAQARVES